MDHAMMAKSYAMQNAAPDYASNATAAPQSASDAIILRLNAIRSNLMDARDGLSQAADKIVGTAPTPIQQTGIGQIKGERQPASCFLDALQQVIGDIEIIGAEAHEHLNRLHRSF